VIKSGEYQLPDALRRLTVKGVKFKPGKVDEWLDCGNKEVTVYTNQRVLEFDKAAGKNMQAQSAKITNSVIIPPCFIGENVEIENTIVGPHVSIGKGTKIVNSIVKNTIVQNETLITNANLENSMIGSKAIYKGKANDISLGDFSVIS
ncbi:MAG: nucleotidyltransferase, partial [Bacteroidota bacterium]